MKSTVPFTMENPLWIAETEGILSADEADLKFEFRTSDVIVGLVKSDIRIVNIPFDRIEGITYRKRLFSGCFIIIRVNEMRAASELPGLKQGEVKLTIARKHREMAAEFVSAVQMALAARKKID
jgi:hypothetical protein